jgi:hypothetical protein
MAMVAYFGISFRRGATVTAFSLASVSTRSATASAGRFGISALASNRAYSKSSVSTIQLKAATAEICNDLAKTLDVTHPSYEGTHQLRMISYVYYF